jgi:Uma2 family endonuclease
MADNTKQALWIATLWGNLLILFHNVPNVFVAFDLLWYAVEGHSEVSTAPDVMIVFGRPKGHRGSYKQWEEDDIPVTVAFEILSPGNTDQEMARKFLFYDDHGVEEYYIYDPDRNQLEVYRRKGSVLRRVRGAKALVSPRLNIRFDLSGPEMVVYYPNGERFLTHEELAIERQRERQRAARMAELSRKARRQQTSAEELAELEQLENEASQ